MSLRAELVRLGLRWFVKRKIGPAPLRWIPATSSLPRLLPQIELLRYGGASGSGAPPGERNGQFRHGERTKTAIAERQKFSALLKLLRAG